MRFEEYKTEKEDENKIVNKDSKRKKIIKTRKALMTEVRRVGRSAEQKRMDRMLLSNPTTKKPYVFHNTLDKNKTLNVTGVEFSEFNQERDGNSIIHGVLHLNEYDVGGRTINIKTEDIYVYQPRFELQGHLAIGPRFRKDGTLNNRALYYFQDPKTNLNYVGNIPKREITTNRQFDFDAHNPENYMTTCVNVLSNKNKSLKNIVSIEYDRDANGNIKTVDLSNREELNRLQAYLTKNATPEKAESNIELYIKIVNQELAKAEEADQRLEEAVERAARDKKALKEAATEAATKSEKSDYEKAQEEYYKMANDRIKYGIQPTIAALNEYEAHHNNGMPVPPPPGRMGPGPRRR